MSERYEVQVEARCSVTMVLEAGSKSAAARKARSGVIEAFETGTLGVEDLDFKATVRNPLDLKDREL